MGKSSLTAQEFELHLKDLREKLREYLETGEGKYRDLRRQAENVLALAEEFPAVYRRYEDIEGLVAAMLAREKQKEFMTSEPAEEKSGCLLGWLFRSGSGSGSSGDDGTTGG